jgi:hypothetical protein
VQQTEAIRELEAFASADKECPGAFTIGDEKARLFTGYSAIQLY